jgi:acyl carrier protein
MDKQEIYAWVARHLNEMFEIAPERITPEARLYQDLDIDSIDAVDLIVRLRPLVGRRLQPEAFKSVRTVQDVVEAIHRLMNDAAAP